MTTTADTDRWHVDDKDDCRVRDGSGLTVLIAKSPEDTALAAAAPDLQAAAREGLEFVEDWMGMRGYPEHAEDMIDYDGQPEAIYLKRDRLRAAIAKAEGGH